MNSLYLDRLIIKEHLYYDKNGYLVDSEGGIWNWYFIGSCPWKHIDEACKDPYSEHWYASMGIYITETEANNRRLELQSLYPEKYFTIFRANTINYNKYRPV